MGRQDSLVSRERYAIALLAAKPSCAAQSRIAVANVLSEGIFAFTGCACIVKGHPDKREVADAFINELLGVEAQNRMANLLWFGPTNDKVQIPAGISTNLLHTKAQWDSIIPIDLDNLANKREEWIQKYTRSLA